MLYAFGFERVGVLVGDLYFLNPRPEPGQQGAERGVRLEVRMLEKGELKGSIYSAQPIAVDRPIWRADLLESVDSEPGSLDRVHHHPDFRGWEPGKRHFDAEMSAAPLDFLARRLADLEGMLERAGTTVTDADLRDAEALRRTASEIVDVVRRLLDAVKTGKLGRAPDQGGGLESARLGWL